MMRIQKKDIHVLLHNIRSAHNVGAIFRAADALGVSQIHISGYTPCPIDRFGRPVKEIAKTALGAEKAISWEYRRSPNTIIQNMKREGFICVGIEQDERALDYKAYRPEQKTLLVVGNEVRGMSHALRAECDVLLEIPMHGKKESLNVAVSFGIAAFQLFDISEE